MFLLIFGNSPMKDWKTGDGLLYKSLLVYHTNIANLVRAVHTSVLVGGFLSFFFFEG